MANLCWRCALPCLHDATQPTRRGIRTQHTRRDAAYTARKPNAAYTARRSLHGAKKICILDTTQPTRRGNRTQPARREKLLSKRHGAAEPSTVLLYVVLYCISSIYTFTLLCRQSVYLIFLSYLAPPSFTFSCFVLTWLVVLCAAYLALPT